MRLSTEDREVVKYASCFRGTMGRELSSTEVDDFTLTRKAAIESKVRIFTVESLRFPGEGLSARGKSGPKLRPEGVSDGRSVEIPILA